MAVLYLSRYVTDMQVGSIIYTSRENRTAYYNKYNIYAILVFQLLNKIIFFSKLHFINIFRICKDNYLFDDKVKEDLMNFECLIVIFLDTPGKAHTMKSSFLYGEGRTSIFENILKLTKNRHSEVVRNIALSKF